MNARTHATETALVRAIVKRLRTTWPGLWVIKSHGNPYSGNGVPDLLVSYAGHFAALEVKHRKPGETVQHALGRVSAGQRRRVAEIRAAGSVADVVLSEDQAEAVVRYALGGPAVCLYEPIDWI